MNMGNAFTKADLTEAIYQRIGLSRSESADIVGAVIEAISATLEKGENVKISGFGAFNIREKRERIGRNPKTGEEVVIPPRRVLSFKASHILQDLVK